MPRAVSQRISSCAANTELGLLNAARDSAILARGPLLVDEESELVFKGELLVRRHLHHFAKAL